MSPVSSAGSSIQFTPTVKPARVQSSPKPAISQPASGNDPDHDGDTDAPGKLDVRG